MLLVVILGIIGVIVFIKSKKTIILDNENKILDKGVIKEIFTNKGIICYFVFTISIFVIKSVIK